MASFGLQTNVTSNLHVGFTQRFRNRVSCHEVTSDNCRVQLCLPENLDLGNTEYTVIYFM